MMKPKAALVKSGFLPAGSENKRGRLSAAAIAECERLVTEEGYQIEGFALVAQPTGSTAPREVEKVKVVAGEKAIADIGEPFRDERRWTAYANVNGKVVSVGMRTVDNVCGNSLTYCPCKSPMVNMGHLPGVDPETVAVVNFKHHD